VWHHATRVRAKPVIVGILLTTLVACSHSANRTATGSGTTSSVAPDSHPYAKFGVGSEQETFVDTSRRTTAPRLHIDLPARTFKTTVFYPSSGAVGSSATADAPVAAGRFPLVVFIHGYTAAIGMYESYAIAVAEAGYVVATPVLPLTGLDSDLITAQSAFEEDDGSPAKDVSFLLSQIAHGHLAASIDPTLLAVGGHSLGGATAVSAGLFACCRDPRVKAVVAVSPGADPNFYMPLATGAGLPPSLYFAGDNADDPTPARNLVAEAATPHFFVFLPGAGHNGPVRSGTSTPQGSVVVKASIDFLDQYLKGDATGVNRLRKDVVPRSVARLEVDAP
jgi:dienelactone hydrolase